MTDPIEDQDQDNEETQHEQSESSLPEGAPEPPKNGIQTAEWVRYSIGCLAESLEKVAADLYEAGEKEDHEEAQRLLAHVYYHSSQNLAGIMAYQNQLAQEKAREEAKEKYPLGKKLWRAEGEDIELGLLPGEKN